MKKKESLFETIHASGPDIIVACETWLSPEIADTDLVLPENYISYRKDRSDGYCGVLVAIKTDLISEPISLVDNTSELQAVKVTLVGENPLIICNTYRPTNRDVD